MTTGTETRIVVVHREPRREAQIGDSMELVKASTQMVTTDPSAVAAAEAAKARVLAAYMVAAHNRRDEMEARDGILKACARLSFATEAIYKKPVGGQTVQGPSIRLVEHALRCWRNVDIQVACVYEDAQTRRVSVRVVDLETNSSFAKEIQICKSIERKTDKGRDVLGERINSKGEKVFIVLATDDEVMNKENALVSKAIRNEGRRLIPEDIMSEAEALCLNTIQRGIDADPKKEAKALADSFSTKCKVSPAQLAQYLRHPIDQCSPAEIADLRMVYSGIVGGETTWQAVMDQRAESAGANEHAADVAKASIAEMAVAAQRVQPQPQPQPKQQPVQSLTREEYRELLRDMTLAIADGDVVAATQSVQELVCEIRGRSFTGSVDDIPADVLPQIFARVKASFEKLVKTTNA